MKKHLGHISEAGGAIDAALRDVNTAILRFSDLSQMVLEGAVQPNSQDIERVASRLRLARVNLRMGRRELRAAAPAEDKPTEKETTT